MNVFRNTTRIPTSTYARVYSVTAVSDKARKQCRLVENKRRWHEKHAIKVRAGRRKNTADGWRSGIDV